MFSVALFLHAGRRDDPFVAGQCFGCAAVRCWHDSSRREISFQVAPRVWPVRAPVRIVKRSAREARVSFASKLLHERRQIGDRERRKVLRPWHRRHARGEVLFRGRIVAAPVALSFGPIENRLDPNSGFLRGHRLHVCEHVADSRSVESGNRGRPESLEGAPVGARLFTLSPPRHAPLVSPDL